MYWEKEIETMDRPTGELQLTRLRDFWSGRRNLSITENTLRK